MRAQVQILGDPGSLTQRLHRTQPLSAQGLQRQDLRRPQAEKAGFFPCPTVGLFTRGPGVRSCPAVGSARAYRSLLVDRLDSLRSCISHDSELNLVTLPVPSPEQGVA